MQSLDIKSSQTRVDKLRKFIKRIMILFLVAFSCFNTSFAEQTKTIPIFVLDYLGSSAGENAPKIGRQYYTGFESIDEFKNFYIVPQNQLSSTTQDLSNEVPGSGNFSHKAIINEKNAIIENENTNHRAYPTFQFEKTSIGILKGSVLVEFSVWADFKLSDLQDLNWFSLATFTSYSDQYWYRSYLINIDANYKIHLMHVPQQGQVIHDIYQSQSVIFPMKKWVKITAYIDYLSSNRFNSPFIAVWQDGNLISVARFDNRIDLISALKMENRPKCLDGLPVNGTIEQAENLCGLVFTDGLAQAHFGLYAPPGLASGTIFNDDLTISEIIH